MIRRVHALPGQPCGLEIAHAVRRIANEQVPTDVIAAVAVYATQDPDPSSDGWRTYDSPEEPSQRAITAAINSVRGAAAWAIGALLFADAARIEQLEEAVESAVRDPVLAVRAVVPQTLAAILRRDESRSLDLFNTLCTGADPILGTEYVEQYLQWAAHRSYGSVRPILRAMLASPESSARRTAARQICLAGLGDGETQVLAMADVGMVLGGDAEMRAAAAEIYARNCGHPDIAEQCVTNLSRFFDDPDEQVRRAAGRCFHHIDTERLAEYGDLIEAFVHSASFAEGAFSLMDRLNEMRAPLPPYVALLADRAVEVWGVDAGDIGTSISAGATTLSKLIVRFYAQSKNDGQREQVLNAIDDLLKIGFIGLDEELRAADRA